MNAHRLLSHYEKIADAPDAIPRLRRFLVDLAVHGKLVEQHPNDEPVSELLKQIMAEKVRRVKEGEIRKPRDLSNGNDLEPLFDIPATWHWCRLDSIGAIVGGGTPSATDPANFAEPGRGISWLTPADLGGYSGLYVQHGSRDLSEKGLQSSSATVMPAGTVLFTSRAPIGYVAIAANPLSTNQGFKSIVPYVGGCSRFVALAMRAFAPDIDAKAPGTTFKEVSGKIVAGLPFPLPPLREQHRIIARVDELMALCDALEAARTVREAARDNLTAASFARLNAPDRDTYRADGRFVLDALPALTARPDQIKQLRQSILNLAVRGKLVPQDKAEERENQTKLRRDEDAEEYDRRAFEERSALFLLPQTWTIEPLSRVSENIVDCPHTTPQWTLAGVLCIRTSQVRAGTLDLSSPNFVTEDTYRTRIERLEPRCDDILYIREGGVRGVGCRIPDNTRLCLGQRLMLIRANKSVTPAFLELCINSPWITDFALEKTTGGAAPRVNMSVVRAYPIPIPPISEQHRIVIKVDELMALCDQLHANLTTADETRRRLLEALLAQALVPDDERELEAAE
jgi:type I restriction enzyme S subunit